MSARTSLFLFCLLGVLLSACAPSKYIDVYENSSLASLSAGEYSAKRERALAKCRLDVLKIAVPNPSCDYVQSCHTDKEGKVQCTTREFCDYSAQESAYNARRETMFLCMRLDGWEAVKKLNPEWVEWQKNK